MGERRRKKKQPSAQGGSLSRRTQSQRPGLLRLQGDAGNRAVTELLGSLSGVPQPSVVRTPLGVTATVYFSKNSAFLDTANFQVVEQLAGELGYLFEPVVAVDGHASGEGKESHNLSLSQRRRQMVIALLTAGLKTPPDVKGAAFGETQPAVPEEAQAGQDVEQQRAQNRRVEITIVYSQQASNKDKKRKPDFPDLFDFTPPHFEPPRGPFGVKPPPPIKRPKISAAGEFDKEFNQVADDVLDRLSIKKPWARTLLKKGARAAIDKGAETILDKAMDEAGLHGDTREAFKKGLEAGLKFEF
jgi:outer membrane protein OmpA-like peptidoglycan-associated protein